MIIEITGGEKMTQIVYFKMASLLC